MAANHKPEYEDKRGHDLVCVFFWHCWAALLQTDGGTEEEACFENYSCVFSARNNVLS
ncbi:MAG: hypothetical protein IKG21_01430 [Atopobiaceae bacterium]|nr:hypothetical protein [Atopobiaceae bacterium]